jgi:hypothetical protein
LVDGKVLLLFPKFFEAKTLLISAICIDEDSARLSNVFGVKTLLAFTIFGDEKDSAIFQNFIDGKDSCIFQCLAMRKILLSFKILAMGKTLVSFNIWRGERLCYLPKF